MDNSNQVLQPTGQAAPQTSNQQFVPPLNITQSANNLQQNNTPSLYLGQSNSSITLPDGTKTENSTSTNVTSNTVAINDNETTSKTGLLTATSLLCLILFVVIVFNLLKKSPTEK